MTEIVRHADLCRTMVLPGVPIRRLAGPSIAGRNDLGTHPFHMLRVDE